MVHAAVWSKLGVSSVCWRDLAGAEVRQARINTGENDGRHEETRTPDLYRVNLEVVPVQPSFHLAFPRLIHPQERCENRRF